MNVVCCVGAIFYPWRRYPGRAVCMWYCERNSDVSARGNMFEVATKYCRAVHLLRRTFFVDTGREIWSNAETMANTPQRNGEKDGKFVISTYLRLFWCLLVCHIHTI